MGKWNFNSVVDLCGELLSELVSAANNLHPMVIKAKRCVSISDHHQNTITKIQLDTLGDLYCFKPLDTANYW